MAGRGQCDSAVVYVSAVSQNHLLPKEIKQHDNAQKAHAHNA